LDSLSSGDVIGGKTSAISYFWSVSSENYGQSARWFLSFSDFGSGCIRHSEYKQIFFWQFPQLKDNITIAIKTGFQWLPPNPRVSGSVEMLGYMCWCDILHWMAVRFSERYRFSGSCRFRY
jgi:hypothetical protein